MANDYFSKDHEWISVEDNVGTVGITNYAQKRLGDVVFVDLPEIGRVLNIGDETAVIESVKAASEVYAPVSGKVIAINDSLANDPSLVNRNAEDKGWFFRLSLLDSSELDGLIDEAAYRALCQRES